MNRYIRTRTLNCDRLENRDNPVSSFLATGATAGGLPLVDVQRPDGTTLTRFLAYDDGFRGGVRAEAAELDGNADTVEVVTGAGPGGGPHVKAFRVNLNTAAVDEIASFFPFESSYRGGIRVTAGRFDPASTVDQIVVAADGGGGPRVQVFRLDGTAGVPVSGPLGNFFAFEGSFRGGVRVAAGELDGDAGTGDELVVSAGTSGGPRVKVFRTDGVILADYFAFRQDFFGGVNVDVENTGTLVGRVRVDGEGADFSQRNAALNQFASAAVQPQNAGTVTNNVVTTGTAVTTVPVTANGVSTLNTVGLNNTLGTNGFNNNFNTGFNNGFNDFNTGLGNTAFTNGLGTNAGLGVNSTLNTAGFPSTTTGLSTGFFPSAGTSAFGTNTFGTTGFTNGFNTGFGTTGFNTGTGSTLTGTTVNTGFGTTGFGTTNGFTTTGFGTFGDPGVATTFPGLVGGAFTGTPFTTNGFVGTSAGTFGVGAGTGLNGTAVTTTTSLI